MCAFPFSVGGSGPGFGNSSAGWPSRGSCGSVHGGDGAANDGSGLVLLGEVGSCRAERACCLSVSVCISFMYRAT